MTATDGFEASRREAIEIGRARHWADIHHVWSWERHWDPPFYARGDQ